MIKIGLLGCGNIARIIAKHRAGVDIVAIYDRIPERVATLSSQLSDVRACNDFQSFINSNFDMVVEAASIDAVFEYAEEVLKHGKDLIVLSVGAFANEAFKRHITDLALASGNKIHISSGALFGLDNLKVGQISALHKLLLRTTKHPSSLKLDLTERTLLFKGTAAECIKLFPRNVNVAVSVSLAAGKEADVELWADPEATRNTHEVFIEGEFGEATISIQNVPSPDNPATSYLAALSILTLLKNIDNPLVIGT